MGEALKLIDVCESSVCYSTQIRHNPHKLNCVSLGMEQMEPSTRASEVQLAEVENASSFLLYTRASAIVCARFHRLQCEPILRSDANWTHARLTAFSGSAFFSQWDIGFENLQFLLEAVVDKPHADSVAERLGVGVTINLTVTGHELIGLFARAAEKQAFAKLGPCVAATIDAQTNNAPHYQGQETSIH
jgi:hypothetical protein